MKNESIHIDSLAIGYRVKNADKVVAAGLTAEVGAGALTCLLGPNGVGKSTLMRTLAGFQPALGGTVTLGGRQLQAYGAASLARVVSVVLTEQTAAQGLTVGEVVALGRTPYTDFWGRLGEDDRAQVDEALSQTGIRHLTGRYVHTLSDGERQKVMIAKALAQATPIILLDEPTAFLDFPSKVEMMQLLRRLAHDTGKVIFLSTHDVELAFRMADMLWVMQAGGSVRIGTPAVLAGDGTLAQAFANPCLEFLPDQLAFKVKPD